MGQGSSEAAKTEEKKRPADDNCCTKPAVGTVLPPVAASSSERQSPDNMVAVDKVIAQSGSIPIAGRYTNTRSISSDYKVEPKVVGSGMSGPVQLATGITDGLKYAVKSFKKKGLSVRRRRELKSEVEIYLVLDHPHIARLEMVYESNEEIDLVMEFMAGGELYYRLSTMKRYTEELAADTAHQMLLAVAYLHANQIVHRDLKLENFLYEKKDSNHLKLIDFGFAKFWDRSTKMTQACGSVHYVAPEVLCKKYTEKCDLWSLGVIVYMLLTGSPPFHGSDSEIMTKIKAGKPHWSSRFEKLSPGAKSFTRALLVLDAEKRLSAEEALAHPWIKGRSTESETVIDVGIVESLRNYAHAASFKRAVLSMMAWSLSAEDRVELREQFLALDKEQKGTITHNQLKQVLETTFHVDCNEAEELFRSLDYNNDNEINYSEFLAAALQGRVKVHEDILRRTFHRFDIEECGLISADDLRKVLGNHFEGIDVKDIIAEVDSSGDGKIDYDEFLAFFHKADEAAEEAQTVEREASIGSPPADKSLHIEKLGLVIDRLITNAASQDDCLALSPKTPKPLCRRLGKAKTLPVVPTASE